MGYPCIPKGFLTCVLNLIFMRILSLFSLLILGLSACQSNQQADLLVYNAKVYTVDSSFTIATAFAIKDGLFVGVDSKENLKKAFDFRESLDAQGQIIYPGLIDAHCHFYGMGTTLQKADLTGTNSFDEVVDKMIAFQEKNTFPYLTGRGWDQEDWEVKEYPNNKKISELWPDIPVVVRRIDGHAALANDYALSLAGFTADTKIEGGSLLHVKGKLTGILIDNAVDTILHKVIPKPDLGFNIKSLKDAEKITLSYGLTTMSDAGLDVEIIDLIDSLQSLGELQSRIYAMVSARPENINTIEKRGAWFKDKLQVNSFKFYLDGSLGSRGACLLHAYDDKPEWSGFLLNSEADFRATAKRLAAMDFQLNTHCIGDSANRIATEVYTENTQGTDLRWRIEHAQVVNEADFEAFKNPNILPSVQPTHATSDMYWAEKRLGPERIKGAYAYKRLLEANGSIALGTDFPVEQVSPFLTFYAAVGRQDLDGFPENGFEMDNALSREEALRGMTIWAAYANKQEHLVGSIEIGKKADFILTDTDWMEAPLPDIPNTKVKEVYIGGEQVFEK